MSDTNDYRNLLPTVTDSDGQLPTYRRTLVALNFVPSDLNCSLSKFRFESVCKKIMTTIFYRHLPTITDMSTNFRESLMNFSHSNSKYFFLNFDSKIVDKNNYRILLPTFTDIKKNFFTLRKLSTTDT